VLLPIPILIGATLWGLIFLLSRYVSLASIILGVSLPVSCWVLPLFTTLKFSPAEFWFAAAIAAFNVWTHRSNIGRLLAGTENRFTKKA
jgi:glycerol-3-phosphate acyltransferase PlsY